MSKKNPSVIKVGKDGQFYHQSGSSMGSMSAASNQAYKNLQLDAKTYRSNQSAQGWRICYW